MQRLALDTQTLYAELVERLTALDASRSMGSAPGTFVTKTVKGEEYYYFQYSEPGGTKQQSYIGRKDAALDAVVTRYREESAGQAEDIKDVERLATMLRAGGAMVTDAPSARVLKALSDSAVFRVGGVLVGTHAFVAIGNMLGVRWAGYGLRTQDIDIATAANLSIAVGTAGPDVPSTLASLEMGFLPVPGLDPAQPSTSFKVRGQGLRVDLLTPTRRGRKEGPVPVPRLKAAAQPMKYLDYVLESVERAAIVSGGGILVNVPAPARFALHKAVVSSLRPATEQTKSEKDLTQAVQVLEVLAEDRPGDIALAWDAFIEHGRSWERLALTALSAVERKDPRVGAAVGSLVGRR